MKNEHNTDPLGEMLSQINQSGNPRDDAFRVMSENIWKPEMLKQMGRFDKGQLIDMIKNYMVLLLYEKRWSEIKVRHTVEKQKDYPYYKVKTQSIYKKQSINEFLETSAHATLCNWVTESYIGVAGQARDECFNFLTSYAKAMEDARLRAMPTPTQV